MERVLPLTVAMIARNEAAVLPLSLGSVAGWVAEIVVVINDCSDATAEVARSYGARVEEMSYENMRDQKTKAVALATQPWVLQIDADEVVSPALRAEIEAFFAAGTPADGVLLPRRLRFMNRWMRHGDVYPDRVLRLFRRGKARQTGTPEHDRFGVEGKVIRFRSDLLHHSNDSIERQIGKINFFSTAFLLRQREKGKRFSVAEAVFRPSWRFFRAYVLRRGFLDGFPGFHLAFFSAFTTFIRYARIYEAELKERPDAGK